MEEGKSSSCLGVGVGLRRVESVCTGLEGVDFFFVFLSIQILTLSYELDLESNVLYWKSESYQTVANVHAEREKKIPKNGYR